MDAILIEPKDKENFKLLLELAKKLGSKVITIDSEQAEDIALLSIMKHEKTDEFVSESEIMKILKS